MSILIYRAGKIWLKILWLYSYMLNVPIPTLSLCHLYNWLSSTFYLHVDWYDYTHIMQGQYVLTKQVDNRLDSAY